MQPLLRTVWVLTLLAAPVASPAVAADCEQLLNTADAAYQTGRFEEALRALEACLASNPARGARVPVLALQAKTQLAMDDRQAAAGTISRLLAADPQYTYDAVRDPPLFLRMIDELRQEDTTVKISSVSKTPESLREAPATVTVITAEEIRRRGYLDLEQVLHDLSGLDISRTDGAPYSNIYPRGYRSDETNRTQFLVDGVTENDLFSSSVWLSRQYPLANVERIELIYGPASTMYGANAFTGVLNVITRQPGDFIEDQERFAVKADVTAGSFNTRTIDTVVAGRAATGSLSWSVSGRIYQSDGMDLSRFDDWDYDPAVFDGIDYKSVMSIVDDGAGRDGFLSFLTANGIADCTSQPGCLFQVTDTSVLLTDAGEARARSSDRALMTGTFSGASGRLVPDAGGISPGFVDETDDWLLYGKLATSNLELGFQVWRRDEGWAPWRTDRSSFGRNNWIPEQSWFYLRYSRAFEKTALTVFSRFKQDDVDGRSRQIFISDYSRKGLGIENLAAGEDSFWTNFYSTRSSNQLTNEVRVVYDPGPGFDLVSGLELKLSSVQGAVVDSFSPNPSETGSPRGGSDQFGGDNTFDVQDLGLYAQASYRPRERLKLVLGGRLDDNSVRDTGGYGTVFNPRLAVVWTPTGELVLKAIYATAFQDAPNLQKFQSTESILPNVNLAPERVESLELDGGWSPGDRFSVNVSAYQASYDDVVQLTEISDTCAREEFPQCTGPLSQFRGIGALRIQGLQVDASWKHEDLTLYGNYTFTDPYNKTQGKRIGDIADHQLNLGANLSWRQRFNFNLRVNYVGAKQTGATTDQQTNPLGVIGSYLVGHGSVTYKDFYRGASLQLILNNIFDEEYYHHGIRGADGLFRASQVPQPERSAFLRLSISY